MKDLKTFSPKPIVCRTLYVYLFCVGFQSIKLTLFITMKAYFAGEMFFDSTTWLSLSMRILPKLKIF
jgi:hypothetical protein